MTAAENIRAYLTARTAFQNEEALQRRPYSGTVIDEQFDYTSRKYVQLREADLEVVLQMLDLLAAVAGQQTGLAPEENPQGYALWIAERQARENPHLPEGYAANLQRMETER